MVEFLRAYVNIRSDIGWNCVWLRSSCVGSVRPVVSVCLIRWICVRVVSSCVLSVRRVLFMICYSRRLLPPTYAVLMKLPQSDNCRPEKKWPDLNIWSGCERLLNRICVDLWYCVNVDRLLKVSVNVVESGLWRCVCNCVCVCGVACLWTAPWSRENHAHTDANTCLNYHKMWQRLIIIIICRCSWFFYVN